MIATPHFYGFADLDFIDFLFLLRFALGSCVCHAKVDFYQYLDRQYTTNSEIRLSPIADRSFFVVVVTQ